MRVAEGAPDVLGGPGENDSFRRIAREPLVGCVLRQRLGGRTHSLGAQQPREIAHQPAGQNQGSWLRPRPGKKRSSSPRRRGSGIGVATGSARGISRSGRAAPEVR